MYSYKAELCSLFNLYNIFPKPLRWSTYNRLNDRSAIAWQCLYRFYWHSSGIVLLYGIRHFTHFLKFRRESPTSVFFYLMLSRLKQQVKPKNCHACDIDHRLFIDLDSRLPLHWFVSSYILYLILYSNLGGRESEATFCLIFIACFVLGSWGSNCILFCGLGQWWAWWQSDKL